jgi:carbonic anhydrase
MSEAQKFIEANEVYAARFDKGHLPIPPARRVAILTCMDARIDPAQILGLEIGDAHVIRNAGGRASGDALRSLIISEQLLGTQEIVVIHHTGCGMLTFSNEALRSKLEQQFHVSADAIDFLPFSNLEQSVRDDIATIKASPFIPDNILMSGFIYDVETGKLVPVN